MPQSKLGNSKAHQAGAYLQSLLFEAARSISTPPGWDASPSQVTSQDFVRLSPKAICWFPFIHLDGERHCES